MDDWFDVIASGTEFSKAPPGDPTSWDSPSSPAPRPVIGIAAIGRGV